MKDVVVFSLSCLFLFFAPVSSSAQDCEDKFFFMHHDVESAINSLEQQQNCLNEKLKDLDLSHDHLGDILELQDKLRQTEHRLFTAERKIEMLEDRLQTAEMEMQELKFNSRVALHRASKPTPDANKAKSQADKPKPAQ